MRTAGRGRGKDEGGRTRRGKKFEGVRQYIYAARTECTETFPRREGGREDTDQKRKGAEGYLVVENGR